MNMVNAYLCLYAQFTRKTDSETLSKRKTMVSHQGQ